MPLRALRSKIDEQPRLVVSVKPCEIRFAGNVFGLKVPDDLPPQILCLDAVVVDLVGRAVRSDVHFGDVSVNVFFRVSGAGGLGFDKEQKNALECPALRVHYAWLGTEIQEREEALALRERVKEIFKKYGFTVTTIIIAAGTVIGAVIGALTNSPKALGKGVGKGLQEIGKKTASLLSGLISSIVSFIFKAAGQVISFLLSPF